MEAVLPMAPPVHSEAQITPAVPRTVATGRVAAFTAAMKEGAAAVLAIPAGGAEVAEVDRIAALQAAGAGVGAEAVVVITVDRVPRLGAVAEAVIVVVRAALPAAAEAGAVDGAAAEAEEMIITTDCLRRELAGLPHREGVAFFQRAPSVDVSDWIRSRAGGHRRLICIENNRVRANCCSR